MNKRSLANLTTSLRATRKPRHWVAETLKLLSQLHAGSYAVVNRQRLAAQYRKFLRKKRRQVKASACWRPKKKLSQYPPFTQAKARGARLALEAYHEALVIGALPVEAEKIACSMWLLIFGKATGRRNLRRRINLINARGGILRAPIEAHADEKSCAHPKAWKSKS
jgi:hypothetical protein